MPDFGIMRGFNDKLFGDKLVAGQLPTQLGLIGSLNITPFLLDLYPNAAAAYSLRKLRDAYTGSAIRVRRSSDNTEQDIGFDVNGNLNTTALTSFCGASNGFVTTWYDQSGNARNATQSSAGNQPKIVSNGSVIYENSNPSLNFDGAFNFLTNTTPLSYSDFSLFGAFKFLSASQYAVPMQYSKLDIAKVLSDFQTSDTGIATITSYNFSFVGTSLMRLHTIISTIAPLTTTVTMYLNGTQKATGSRNLTSTKNLLSIGATDGGGIPINGNLSEFILYPNNQSSNKINIESNINTYYGIY